MLLKRDELLREFVDGDLSTLYFIRKLSVRTKTCSKAGKCLTVAWAVETLHRFLLLPSHQIVPHYCGCRLLLEEIWVYVVVPPSAPECHWLGPCIQCFQLHFAGREEEPWWSMRRVYTAVFGKANVGGRNTTRGLILHVQTWWGDWSPGKTEQCHCLMWRFYFS